jgi:hypothetical protein
MWLSVTAAAQPIRIGVPLGETAHKHQIQQRVGSAYQQLGYTPQFIALPSQRRLMLLQDGLIDADLFRICELDDNLSNVLVVPVVIDSMQLNAYSLNAATLQNWQQRRDLLISHIRGFKMASQQQFAGKRIMVSDAEQAFGLMLQGRVDIVLEDSDTAALFLTQQPATTPIAEQTVASFGVCHILSQQQQALLPALTEVLRQTQ